MYCRRFRKEIVEVLSVYLPGNRLYLLVNMLAHRKWLWKIVGCARACHINQEVHIMTVKSLPKRPHGITAYLACDNASEAIDFYVRAFCAEQTFSVFTAQGKVGHAELRIGDSSLMVADRLPGSPMGAEAGAIALHLYVDNVDARFARVIQAGAVQISAPTDHFYGDRSGVLRDPYGIVWFMATHKEDLTAEQISQRVDQEFGGIGAHS
jgi:PhnB protein